MSKSSVSPIAPARVQGLLVPVGEITRSKFDQSVARLQQESLVRLSDISPDGRSDRTMFSPLAFPSGFMLFNLITANMSESATSLAPFELCREPLLLIGICDGSRSASDAADFASMAAYLDAISADLQNVIMAHTVVFEAPAGVTAPTSVSAIPSKGLSRRTTIKTLMCDIASKFLSELVVYARSIQNARTIDIPEPSSDLSSTRLPVAAKLSSEMVSPSSHASGSSRPATPMSAGDPVGDVTNTSGLRRLPAPASSMSPPAASSSPASGDVDRPTTDRLQSRPNSPETWVAATGSAARPLSSSSLPSQVKTASAAERSRNRLKGRQSVAIGTLYLMAGRWNDALRELVDGTTRSKAFGDHAWHAKGLENLLVAMLLLAWVGADFVIPSICRSPSDASRSRRSTSVSVEGANGQSPAETSKRYLHTLSTLIPELLETICNTLSRPVSLSGALMPQLPFSESIIRSAYLLSCLRLCGNELTRDAITALIDDDAPSYFRRLNAGFKVSAGSRQELSDLLFRAYPTMPPPSSNALYETVLILAGMASVLSLAGMQRKRAVLMRDMLFIMIPGLIHARKVGAAEIGIHPAASLAALHGLGEEGMSYKDSRRDEATELGLRMLMSQLCDAYGIHLDPWNDVLKTGNAHEYPRDGLGSASMKYDVLRLCMNFSEALPNFKDVTEVAAALLRLAGPSSLHAPAEGVQRATIGSDEQARLVTKIYRTLGVVKTSDADKLAPEYWDEYVVRGVELCDPPPSKYLTSRTMSDFEPAVRSQRAASITKHGPFIHDASLAVRHTTATTRITAAGQRSEFWVILQNPYDVEIAIEDIGLVTEGVKFSQRQQVVTLGPARMQRTLISGTAEEVGVLSITGVQIHVHGCKPHVFGIFPNRWLPKVETKIVGVRDLSTANSDARSEAQAAEAESKHDNGKPEAQKVAVTVSPPQPLCVLASHSLSQSIMTILEGETQSFSLTIRNISDQVDVNFVHLSFEHSLRSMVRTEARGVAGQIQAFELKEAALARPPMDWQDADRSVCIKPGGTCRFKVKVFGLRGMTEGIVHIDYASNATTSGFVTRRLTIPFAITVGGSLEVQRFDALTLSRPLSDASSTSEARVILDRFRAIADKTKSFVLLLDLFNAWSQPLSARLQIKDPRRVISDASNRVLAEFQETIPSGQIKRIAVPVPQIFVADITKAPPTGFADAVQFVVADSEEDKLAQVSLLEKFWYKQELLKTLSGSWQDLNGPRHGHLDFSGIDLTHTMIDRIKKTSVTVALQVTCCDERGQGNEETVTRVKTQQLARLHAVLQNNTTDSLALLIRLTPSIAWQKAEQWDIARRLCWTGAFERSIAVLRPDEERKLCWGFAAASSGEYMLQLDVYSTKTSKLPVLLANASINVIVANE